MNSAARQPAVLLLRRASLLRLQRSRFASATYTGNGGCRYGITSQAKLNESSAGSRRRQHTNTNTSTAGRFSSGRWEWESLLTPGACVLLAAALLSSSNQSPASTGWWPFSGWGRQGGRESSSPFDDIVPRRAREQRAKAEVQMRAYLEKKRVPMQRLIESLREGKVGGLPVGFLTRTLEFLASKPPVSWQAVFIKSLRRFVRTSGSEDCFLREYCLFEYS